MDLVKFEARIGGEKHTITHFDGTAQASKVPSRTHHILIIDRSGSMSGSINSLIDQAIKTVEIIDQNDLLSVGWFSGLGQYSFIVRGAKKGEDVVKILNSLRSIVGLTCFSESLQESAKVVLDFNSLVDQTVVTLFTDGQPVTGWSEAEELNRCRTIVESMVLSSNLSAFNTIGYGAYYNPEFLRTLSDMTDHGVHIHTSKITDFLDTFTSGVEAASGLTRSPLSVEVHDSEILYVGSHTSSLYQDEMHMKNTDREKNSIFIINTDTKNAVTINNSDPISVSKVTAASKDVVESLKEDFFYSYAYQLYYSGKRQKALDIIVNNVKDKFIADQMVNAFTIEEVANTTRILREAEMDRKTRYQTGKCPPKYLPKKDALCVMDVFSIMFSTPSSTYYIPFSENVDEYKRIGRKVEDKQNAFVRSSDEVRAPLNEFTWNKDKLNLSILIPIFGHVELNARAAKAENLPQKYPSKIYRNHSFVKDGNLNIEKAEFLINTSVGKSFDEKKLNYKLLGIENVNGDSYKRVLIDFSKLPVINRTYVDNSDSLDDLHEAVIEIARTEASQKVLNSIIKEAYENKPSLRKQGEYSALTLSQITVLEQHGISKEGVYGGIQNEKPSAEESDQYYTRLMKFYVKGCSSLPSIADFKAMLAGSKKTNVGGAYMVEYYNMLSKRYNLNDIDKKLMTVLLEEQDRLGDKLSALRQHLAIVKLAKTLTNDFFHGLMPNDKGDYSYEKSDATMILRSDRVLEYV